VPTNDPKIETYLTSLEKALRALPVSDRADIVTEIKSHILSAMERDPTTPVGEVLSAMGEPETVANRYLAERGQTFVKPPVSPMVKWVVIGFVATIGMLILFSTMVLFRFSPLIEVKDNRVKLLGGLIDVDDDSAPSRTFKGHHHLEDDKRPLSIIAVNSKFDLHNSQDDFRWECKTSNSSKPMGIRGDENGLTMDLSAYEGIKCDFYLPEKHPINIEFTNGKIDVEKPHYDLTLKGANGKIDFEADSNSAYKYNLNVKVGKLDKFSSSDKADAYKIKMQLDNGLITNSAN
jgi:hypothetical protein